MFIVCICMWLLYVFVCLYVCECICVYACVYVNICVCQSVCVCTVQLDTMLGTVHIHRHDNHLHFSKFGV